MAVKVLSRAPLGPTNTPSLKCGRFGHQPRQTERSTFVTQILRHLAKMLIIVSGCSKPCTVLVISQTARNRTLTFLWWNSEHTSFDGCVQERPAQVEKPHNPTV